MARRIYIILILFVFSAPSVFAQTNSLRQQIEHIIATKNATIGISIYGFEDKDTLSINGNRHFPLQSVFKFHIVLYVLNQVDEGKLSLNQKIFVKKSDLLPHTWSPLREEYPNGNVRIPLKEIIRYTITQSDNNGCDILLRLIGGTGAVSHYIHRIGIKNVAIAATEKEMHQAWDVQFTNWTTPKAATKLLRIFYERKILSQKSYDYLWKTMEGTQTGADRIKGELPAGIVVAHKTGTSGTNKQGVTAATNDIGIVTLPNGKHFAISVFVSNSREDSKANAKIIADIAKLTWDYYVHKTR